MKELQPMLCLAIPLVSDLLQPEVLQRMRLFSICEAPQRTLCARPLQHRLKVEFEKELDGYQVLD